VFITNARAIVKIRAGLTTYTPWFYIDHIRRGSISNGHELAEVTLVDEGG